MATLINFSKVEKAIKGLGISKPCCKENTIISIIIPEKTFSDSSDCYECVTLEKSPRITCCVRFLMIGVNLQGEISFFAEASNQQYAVTFYFLNSQYEVARSDTVNAIISAHKSSYTLNYKHQILEYSSKHVISKNLINGNLLILCNIVKINLVDCSKGKKSSQLLSIYEQKLCTDFKIICKDQEFLVHKAVIANASPVFRKMLEVPMKESRENQAQLKDFEPTVIELLIHYIYCPGEIKKDLSQEILKELFTVAHVYEMES